MNFKSKIFLGLCLLSCSISLANITEPPKKQTAEVSSMDNPLAFYFSADFLWWKNQVSGMNYVTMNHGVKAAPFQFDPGFKVAIGSDVGYDGWFTEAEFTWLNNPVKSNYISATSTYGESSVVDGYSSKGTLSVITCNSASSSRNFLFNVLDVTLGKKCSPSSSLEIFPSFGLKFGWIYDEVDYNYVPDSSVYKNVNIKLNQDLFGVGIRAAANTKWKLSKCWDIYGDLALSTLWTSTTDILTDFTEFKISGKAPVSYNVKATVLDVLPIIETSFGLEYRTTYFKDYDFSFKAGWEEQIWINYLKFINTPVNYTGNLSIQGLTLKALFSF